jgi:hypothetical protein
MFYFQTSFPNFSFLIILGSQKVSPHGGTDHYTIIVASGRKYKSSSISGPASNFSQKLSAYVTCNKVSQPCRLVIVHRSVTSGPAKTYG